MRVSRLNHDKLIRSDLKSHLRFGLQHVNFDQLARGEHGLPVLQEII